jgi:hypothetical protein
MYRNNIFNSKYKCTEVLGVIDDTYDMSDDDNLDSALEFNYSQNMNEDIYDTNILEENDLQEDDNDSNWTSEEDYNTSILSRNFEPNAEELLFKYGISKSPTPSSNNNDEDRNEDENEDEDVNEDGNEDEDRTGNEDGDTEEKSELKSKIKEFLNNIEPNLNNNEFDNYDNDFENDSLSTNDEKEFDVESEEDDNEKNYEPSNVDQLDLDTLFAEDIIKYTDELKFKDILNDDNYLINNYVVLCNISKNNEIGNENICKMFIKKSPLLEPTKVAKGIYCLAQQLQLPDIISLNTSFKLNNINNSSHVEAIFLYLGNKLVEDGKTIAFPYYYGCINSIDPNFHSLINDEYEDLENELWFQERISNDLSLVIVDDNGKIVNGEKNQSNKKNSNSNNDTINKLAQELNITIKSEISKSANAANSSGETNLISDNENDIIDLDTIDVDTNSFSHLRKHNKEDLNYFLKIPNMPVNLVFMEYMEETLDDLLSNGYVLNELEWQSLIFQVAFGLAVANKQFSFVHNDLHSSNIMVQKTKQPFMYFQIGKIFYRIPTFGRIYKIIDFARATFKLNGKWIFSDVFQDGNDASDQYDFVPTDGIIPDKHFEPNPSFDLVRFAISVMENLENVPKIKEFFNYICSDDSGNCNYINDDSFQLYIHISHNCHNAVPIKIILSKFFNKFIFDKHELKEKMHIFKY